MWQQRVHTLWLKHNDQNSKSLHRIANARYCHNLIPPLDHQGHTLTFHFDITNTFTTYFNSIFGAPHHPLMVANWEILHPSCDWPSCDLERPFNEEDIKTAVFGLGAEKTLGPDGFSIIFFQKFWDIVKPDITFLSSHNSSMHSWIFVA